MPDNFALSDLRNINPFSVDVATPLGQGLQTGIQLATAQQNIEHSKQQLEIQRQQHKQDSANRAITNLATLSKVKGPARKALFAATQQNFANAGIQIDPNALDYASADPELSQMIAQVAANRDLLKNPDFSAAFFKGLGSIESTAPEFTFLKDHLNNQSREQAAILGNENKSAIAAAERLRKTQEATQGNIVKGATSQFAVDTEALTGGKGEAAKAAELQRIQSLAAQQVGAKVAGTTASQIGAKAGVIRAEAALQGQAGTQAYRESQLANQQKRIDISQQLADSRKAQVGLGKERLAIQEEKFKETLQNRVTSNTQIQKAASQINNANKGLEIISKPNVRWIDLDEAATDVATLLSNSNQVTVSGADRATFNSAKKTWDTWLGRAANREVGGPSPEELAQFRDRIERIRAMTINFHNQQVDRIVEPRSKALQTKYRGALDAVKESATLDANGVPLSKARNAAPAKQAPTGLLESLKAKGASPDLIKKIYQGEGFALPGGL